MQSPTQQRAQACHRLRQIEGKLASHAAGLDTLDTATERALRGEWRELIQILDA